MRPAKHQLAATTLITSLCCSNAVAQQQESGGGFHGVVSAGLTFGGDKLIEVSVEDIFGDDDEQEVRAGGLFSLNGGVAYDLATVPIQLQATIGFHTDGVFADNGDTSFNRFPLELLGFYVTGRHRIGAGISHHINPTFEVDFDFGPNEDVDFDDATGGVIQYDYLVADFLRLGARFVAIEYEPEGSPFYDKVDGNHGGIILTFEF